MVSKCFVCEGTNQRCKGSFEFLTEKCKYAKMQNESVWNFYRVEAALSRFR